MIEDIIKKALPGINLSKSGHDIVLKSKDRAETKSKLEAFLKKNGSRFQSVFKKSKSSSMDVLSIDGVRGDIVFKPIIAKGQGGVSFEKELAVDLQNYLRGADHKDLKHHDVILELNKKVGIEPTPEGSYEILHEGAKNQKRNLVWDGQGLSVTNSTGETLTDITLKGQKKSKHSKLYLSLKMSDTYYIMSAAIEKYFADPKTNTHLCEYLGLDGQKMAGFGPKYFCLTKPADYAQVAKNMEEFLSEVYGTDVVIVHKKRTNDVLVSHVESHAIVHVTGLNENSYKYPEAGKRKHAAITFHARINNHPYKIEFQFRGTTATDVGPKYLRILVERK